MLEKERETEAWRKKVKVATKQFKFCTVCTYIPLVALRGTKLRSNRILGKTATHLPTITHIQYIPDTISLVSFVLIIVWRACCIVLH